MKLNRNWIRSVRGQLTLLGGAYCGAVVLAVAALCLRSLMFEPFARETYWLQSEAVESVLRAAAEGRATSEQERTLSDENADRLYDTWAAGTFSDPEGRLARRLLSVHGGPIMERIRRTLVAGNSEQRDRALTLLEGATDTHRRAEAAELCRYARRRAEGLGDHAFAERADRLLDRLETSP